MAELHFNNDHNKVVYLLKPKESQGFHQIIDFLNGLYIRQSSPPPIPFGFVLSFGVVSTESIPDIPFSSRPSKPVLETIFSPMYLRQASKDDEHAESVSLALVFDITTWEIIPTEFGLGEIHVLTRADGKKGMLLSSGMIKINGRSRAGDSMPFLLFM
nr:hypothetical protein [Tanacetum cinerariifolium]